MYAEFKVELTDKTGLSEEECQYIQNFANPNCSVFMHEGYNKAENILAALIVQRDLLRNVSCEAPWDDIGSNEELWAEVREALCPPFPFNTDDEAEAEAALDRLLDCMGTERFFRRCVNQCPISEWGEELAAFTPARPADEDEGWVWEPTPMELYKLWADPAACEIIKDKLVEEIMCRQDWITLLDTREVDDNWTEIQDENEVYEWRMVSDWLAHQLSDIGEVVVRGVWGRQGTGQGVLLDGVFQEIARRRLSH